MQDAAKIEIPMLLLQAGDDRIVDNDSQTAFCDLIGSHCVGDQPRIIEGAKHELLNESDEYRDQALEEIFRFLDTHST
ncbi:MAG: alpha/beta hydrolase, partial [Pseudomonadota bacterium]